MQPLPSADVSDAAAPNEVVLQPYGPVLPLFGRKLVIRSNAIVFRRLRRDLEVPFTAVRSIRTRPTTIDSTILTFGAPGLRPPVWKFHDEDWRHAAAALRVLLPEVPINPPPPRRHRIAADAALRTGDDPVESLRSVRRATVGRWWVQVRPWTSGFRAEAHTISGPPSVWAGELRRTLGQATDDAIAMIAELRQES